MLCFCVNSSAYFARVLFAFVVLGLVSSVDTALRDWLHGKNVSEMTCFVSSGT